MNIDAHQRKNFYRQKILILFLAALSVTLIEAYYYFIRGVPLLDDLVDWLIGMTIALIFIQLSFRLAKNAYRHLEKKIDSLRHAEAALRESKEMYESLVRTIPDAITVTDLEGRILFVSQGTLDLHGYTKADELLDKNAFILIAPEDHKKAKRNMRKTLEKGNVRNVSYKLLRKDGSEFFGDLSASTIKDRSGNVIKFIATVRDVTERKYAEQTIKESENRYRSLFDGMPIGLYRSTTDGRILDANPALVEMLGFLDLRNLLNINTSELYVDPKDREKWQGQLEENGLVRHFPLRLRRRDGKCIWVEDNARVVKNRKNQVLFYEGAIEDISARKQTEKIRSILINILEATNSPNDLENLLKVIHHELGRLIDTSNFYIALYDERTGLYSFPYCVDEIEKDSSFSPQESRKSLTDYVRRTGKPLLADAKVHRELIKKGEVDMVGEPSSVWMGTPLKTPTGIIGVVVVQNYKDKSIYTNNDLQLLALVSGHIATAIERKRVVDQIKHSLEEKEVLLKEIHHRVKNNLQIISSLLYLQSKHIKDETSLRLFDDSQARIKSMALIHEKLYKSENFANINFADYVKSLTTHLLQTYQVNGNHINLVMKIHDIFFTIEQAIPCGLIVNELVSNALKYAFSGQKSGKICINLFHNDSNGNGKQDDYEYTLIISDNGKGIPDNIDYKKTKSLGLQLVNSLAGQLGGTIELDKRSGTLFKITF